MSEATWLRYIKGDINLDQLLAEVEREVLADLARRVEEHKRMEQVYEIVPVHRGVDK